MEATRWFTMRPRPGIQPHTARTPSADRVVPSRSLQRLVQRLPRPCFLQRHFHEAHTRQALIGRWALVAVSGSALLGAFSSDTSLASSSPPFRRHSRRLLLLHPQSSPSWTKALGRPRRAFPLLGHRSGYPAHEFQRPHTAGNESVPPRPTRVVTFDIYAGPP
jgi:hypothetical protein